MDKSDVGRRGEDIALEYLLQLGMLLIVKNWHSGHKELDLVMEDANFIRFIEVRTRTYPNNIDPAESVNLLKQKNIIFAAKGFLMSRDIKNRFNERLRGKEFVFDVVSILLNGDNYKITYIKNAFGPTW
jgi:Predicted endonuclease distantly related to archaeal Holliday junction resolvase